MRTPRTRKPSRRKLLTVAGDLYLRTTMQSQTMRVTNSVTTTENNLTKTKFYGRDENNVLDSVTVSGYAARFYARTAEVDMMRETLLYDERVIDIDDDVDKQSIYGDELSCIKCRTVYDVTELKDMFDIHFSADVWQDMRTKIDAGIQTGVQFPKTPDGETGFWNIEPVDFTEPDYRVMTFDIEIDDRTEFPIPDNRVTHSDSAIMSIVAYDNYDDEYIGWFDLGGRSMEECFPSMVDQLPDDCDTFGEAANRDDFDTADINPPGKLDTLRVRNGERKMLIDFSCWVSDTNPDIITAWNVDFDVKYLLARMKEIGANPNRLARGDEGKAYLKQKQKIVLDGRHVYDMLKAYESTKFSELDSYRLDYVAQQELDDAKIEHPDMGFWEMYREEPERFLEYNAKDTWLTVEIDREAGVLEFKESMGDRDGTDFTDTMDANGVIEMALRRRLKEKGLIGPSRGQYDGEADDDYEGALVLDAYDGLADNVVGIDLASLYPNNMAHGNMSPETKIDEEVAKENDIPYVKVPKAGVCFRLDQQGIVAGLVDDILDMKADLKKRKKAAPSGTEKEAEIEERYNVTKAVVNSLYGVIGWEHFFMYDPEVAEACTLMGQECIAYTREWVNENTEATVIYGDTDSNYVKFPDHYSKEKCERRAMEIADKLTSEVYPELWTDYYHNVSDENAPDCRWDIEPEDYMGKFFQHGSKKLYAFRVESAFGTDDDGNELFKDLEEPDIGVKGYQCKKSNYSQLTKKTQKKILTAVLNEEGRSHISEILQDATAKIREDIEDWDTIGIPGGLNQRMDPDTKGTKDNDIYKFKDGKPQGAHPRAAWNGNEYLDLNLNRGDKPKRVYLVPGRSEGRIDTIAFNTDNDLEGERNRFTLDVDRMVNKQVVKPNRPILETMGLDIDAAMHGQYQSGITGFC